MKIKYGRNNAEGGNVLNSDFVWPHGLVFLKHKGCTISSEELAEKYLYQSGPCKKSNG